METLERPLSNLQLESRMMLVGKTIGRLVIAVVFTMKKQIYRIISARQARKKKRCKTILQPSLKIWTMNKELNVDSAIDLLKSGGKLEEIIITDLATSKVRMMDALLLARNGYIVPEDNVVYDDDQIQYDPDFDDVTWGEPVPFKKLKQSLESGNQLKETAELIIKLQIKSTDRKQWLAKSGDQINLIVSGLIESMYKAGKLERP